jgi:hypothetical protein
MAFDRLYGPREGNAVQGADGIDSRGEANTYLSRWLLPFFKNDCEVIAE